MLIHTYNPSTWEAEAKGLQVQGQQPGLHSKICLKTKQNNPKTKKRKEGRKEDGLSVCVLRGRQASTG
jgi:hypothetical protein